MKKNKLSNKALGFIAGAMFLTTGIVGGIASGEHQKLNEARTEIRKFEKELSNDELHIKDLEKAIKSLEGDKTGNKKEIDKLNKDLKSAKEKVKSLTVDLDNALAAKSNRESDGFSQDDSEVALSSNDYVEYDNQETYTEQNNQPKERLVASSGGQSLTFEATAYDAVSLGGMTASGYQVTSTGERVIAVDPSVIPLGSRVYIEGYGEAIAADTGGAIQGNIVDLNMSTEDAINFGRQNVTITIL